MFTGRGLKLGVVAALALGITAISAAQAVDNARAEVFSIQVGRFEGTYALNGGATGQATVRRTAEGTEWTVNASAAGKEIQVKASTSFDPQEKRQKATLTVGGKSAQGTAMVVGTDLIVEVRSSEGVRRLRLRLSGRAKEKLTLTQQPSGGAETQIFSADATRNL